MMNASPLKNPSDSGEKAGRDMEDNCMPGVDGVSCEFARLLKDGGCISAPAPCSMGDIITPRGAGFAKEDRYVI